MTSLNKQDCQSKSIQVLNRCFLILEAIAANQGEASLATLGKMLSIPHSTIHRILASLIQLGYVEQNQQNGYYRLGIENSYPFQYDLGKVRFA